ncbi:hypothetical protein HD554DRAFT_241576 [Boletus coccyginus]|nr:hypothetical protein HD554DRAFT_241576 [Boletus coccyginus]
MSSDLQSTLEVLQINDCIACAIATAVLYDHVLTLSREIYNIWQRPWTWISTLFILVRYIGLLGFRINPCSSIGHLGSAFVPGPERVSTAAYLMSIWAFQIFVFVADLVMILRVYAMWNRSIWVLWVLLSIYLPGVIASIVVLGIYDNPSTYSEVQNRCNV